MYHYMAGSWSSCFAYKSPPIINMLDRLLSSDGISQKKKKKKNLGFEKSPDGDHQLVS